MRKKRLISNLFFLMFNITIPILSLFSFDIAGTNWGLKRGFGFYYLFDTEGSFTFEGFGPGGDIMLSGTYIQTGNNITLTIKTRYYRVEGEDNEVNENGYGYRFNEDHVLTFLIVETPNSLFCQYKFEGSYFWLSGHPPEIGEKRAIDGNVAYVYRASGTILENARIREGPGVQYNFYSFYNDYEGNYFTSIEKGSEIKIYGHSEHKTTIDGVEAYWYYCSFFIADGYLYGWIWGGLIDFKE